MPARSYRPSGQSDSGALPLLFVGAAGVGIAAGVALSLIGRFFISLMVVFPMALGFAVGFFASWRIGVGRVRAPLAAGLAGLLGAFAGQLAVHVTDYQLFRLQVAAAVHEQLPDADAGAAVDAYLARKTGHSGFVGYVEVAAENGVTLKRAGDSGHTLTGVWAYLLWAVEFLLAMGTAAVMAFRRAREPFCERCGRWYDLVQGLASGSPEKAAWQSVIRALERSEFSAAAAARGAATEKGSSQLSLHRCGRCEAHQPVLTLTVVTRANTRKPQTAVRYHSLLRPEEASAFIAALKEPPPAG